MTCSTNGTFSYCLHNSFVKLDNNYIPKRTKCLCVNINIYIYYSVLYNCTLICFQNQPSANPTWVLVNFYRCKAYPQRHRFPVTYNSVVDSVDLPLHVLHAIHVFLNGLDYTIRNHLEPVQNSCNYKFKSYRNGKMHVECIDKLTLMLCMYLLIFQQSAIKFDS